MHFSIMAYMGQVSFLYLTLTDLINKVLSSYFTFLTWLFSSLTVIAFHISLSHTMNYSHYFLALSKVLVDAPCSNDRSWLYAHSNQQGEQRLKERAKLPVLQAQLLR